MSTQRPAQCQPNSRKGGFDLVASAQWAALLTGLLLVWLGLFVTPGEQRAYQSIFSAWWVRVETIRERGLSLFGALLVVIAEKISMAADAMFGQRLISVSAQCTSIGLSLLSYACWKSAVVLFAVNATIERKLPVLILFALLGLLGLIVSLFRIFLQKQRVLHAIVALASAATVSFVLTADWLGDMLVRSDDPMSIWSSGKLTNPSVFWSIVIGYSLFIAVPGVVMSFVSDLLFIAVTRKILQHLVRLQSTWRGLSLFAINAALACILFLGPLLSVRREGEFVWGRMPELIIREIVWFNFVDVGVICVFLLVTMAMLVHQAAWPLLSRILEIAEAEKVLTYRKTLIATGLALISLRFVELGEVIRLLKAAG